MSYCSVFILDLLLISLEDFFGITAKYELGSFHIDVGIEVSGFLSWIFLLFRLE